MIYTTVLLSLLQILKKPLGEIYIYLNFKGVTDFSRSIQSNEELDEYKL